MDLLTSSAFGQVLRRRTLPPLSIASPISILPMNRISCHFTSTSSTSPPPVGDTSPNDDRNVNIGHAIDTLRSELPDFFSQGLRNFSIYDSDVVLNEPEHYKFYIKGLRWYRMFLSGARHVLRWYFDNVSLDLKSISHSADNTLHVHWVMQGTPRSSILRSLLTSDSFVERSVYEGLFVYRFNHQGRICEHSIQRIMPAPKQFAPLRAISWFQQRGKMSVELNTTSTSK